MKSSPYNYSQRVIEIRMNVKKAERFLKALSEFDRFIPTMIHALEVICDDLDVPVGKTIDKLYKANDDLNDLYYVIQDHVEQDPMPGRGKK